MFSVGHASSGCALFLGLDDVGRPRVAVRMTDDSWSECVLDSPITDRYWVRLSTSVDLLEGSLTLHCSGNQYDEASYTEFSGSTALKMEKMDCLMMAASETTERQMHFNGKIDNPTVYVGHVDLDTLEEKIDKRPVSVSYTHLTLPTNREV